MEVLLLACLLVLLANVIVALAHLTTQSEQVDRVVVAQLISTLCVAMLMLLAALDDDKSLRLVALLFALLGAVAAGVFVRVLDKDGERQC